MIPKHLGHLSYRAVARCSAAVRQVPVASSTLPSSSDGAFVFIGSRRTHDVCRKSSIATIGNTNIHNRSFSSMGMMPRRGFPQYTIFGPDTALSIRAVLPQFRRAGADGVSVERRGKLVFEFVPRNASGAGFAWNEKTLFSLSVEEVGLLLSQLPGNVVELSHSMNYGVGSDDEGSGGGVMQQSGDLVDKVLTITPGEGATLHFKIDYMKDGIGGQSPPQFDEAKPVSCLSDIFLMRIRAFLFLLLILSYTYFSNPNADNPSRGNTASW
ncbi:hypothetical protein ACHAXM_011363 [Skeletonema potamos]|jgi:hypothetical protein